MNIRRRALARTLALAAFSLAVLAWVFSIFCIAEWNSRPLHARGGLTEVITCAITGGEMSLHKWVGRSPRRRLVVAGPRTGENPLVWWWPHDGLVEIEPRRGAWSGTSFVRVSIPLWAPALASLGAAVLTHRHARRPLDRLRRGLYPASAPRDARALRAIGAGQP